MLSRALLLCLLLMVGCATPAQTGPKPAPKPVLTLRVHNSGIDKQAVYVDGRRLATLFPGESKAIQVMGLVEGAVSLVAESQHGTRDFVTQWRPSGSLCWAWRLPLKGTVGPSFPVPCDVARASETDAGLLRVFLDEDALGVMYCGTKPTAWINAETLNGPEAAQTVAHELDHLRYAREAGGCAALAQQRTLLGLGSMLDMEATAYCVSARVWAEQERVPLEVAIRKYAQWLATYPVGLDPERAAAEIRKRCSQP